MSTAVVVTQVEICNIALGLLGTSRIQSIDDSSAGAIECKARFALSFNHVLRLHPWQFARNYVALTELNETPAPPWLHVYSAPADSVFVRRVFDVNGDDVQFRSFQGKLYCDETGVWCEYTRQMLVTAVPQEVAMAVACHLAFSIAPIIQHDGKHSRDVLYQMFERELSRARHESAVESGPLADTAEDWAAARNSTLGLTR